MGSGLESDGAPAIPCFLSRPDAAFRVDYSARFFNPYRGRRVPYRTVTRQVPIRLARSEPIAWVQDSGCSAAIFMDESRNWTFTYNLGRLTCIYSLAPCINWPICGGSLSATLNRLFTTLPGLHAPSNGARPAASFQYRPHCRRFDSGCGEASTQEFAIYGNHCRHARRAERTRLPFERLGAPSS